MKPLIGPTDVFGPPNIRGNSSLASRSHRLNLALRAKSALPTRLCPQKKQPKEFNLCVLEPSKNFLDYLLEIFAPTSLP